MDLGMLRHVMAVSLVSTSRSPSTIRRMTIAVDFGQHRHHAVGRLAPIEGGAHASRGNPLLTRNGRPTVTMTVSAVKLGATVVASAAQLQSAVHGATPSEILGDPRMLGKLRKRRSGRPMDLAAFAAQPAKPVGRAGVGGSHVSLRRLMHLVAFGAHPAKRVGQTTVGGSHVSLQSFDELSGLIVNHGDSARTLVTICRRQFPGDRASLRSLCTDKSPRPPLSLRRLSGRVPRRSSGRQCIRLPL